MKDEVQKTAVTPDAVLDAILPKLKELGFEVEPEDVMPFCWDICN